MRYQIIHRGMAPLLRFRFWMADFILDRLMMGVVSDQEWLQKLLGSLSVGPGHDVLVLGSHGRSIATALSKMFPAAKFAVGDRNTKEYASPRRQASDRDPGDDDPASDTNVLTFDRHSFDRVVCFLALHERRPEDKLALLREIARVLRRGGTLHAVEFDKPENDQESKMLRVAGRKSRTAVISHLAGTWLSYLAKAGFSRIRRQSSHSIKAGRLSVVTARK
jgi:ubiquinone/menaquinone biosynthesis C-methylase UbiE